MSGVPAPRTVTWREVLANAAITFVATWHFRGWPIGAVSRAGFEADGCSSSSRP